MVSTWLKGPSTRAERLASPRSCAMNSKPKRWENAIISAETRAFLPLPPSRMTVELSTMQVSAAPCSAVSAPVKKARACQRVQRR